MKRILIFGMTLWIGVVSPEIFTEPGMGRFGREDGDQISREEAEDILMSLLSPEESEEDATMQIAYKSRILEWIKDLK